MNIAKTWHTSPKRYFKIKSALAEQQYVVTSQVEMFQLVHHAVDATGRSILHAAFDTNNIAFVLNTVPIVTPKLLNEPDVANGRSLLLKCAAAAVEANEDIERLCMLLIAYGADLSACDDKYSNVFHLLASGSNISLFKSILEAASAKMPPEDLRTLLNNTNSSGFTPLHIAVGLQSGSMVEILSTNPLVDVNATEFTYGFTALHIALGYNQILLKLLQSNRVDVDAAGIYNVTALHLAIVSRNYYAVVLLRERAARIDVCTHGVCFPVAVVQERKTQAECILSMVNFVIRYPSALTSNANLVEQYKSLCIENDVLLPSLPADNRRVGPLAYALGDSMCTYLLQIEPNQKASRQTHLKLFFYSLIRSGASVEDVREELKKRIG